MGRSGPRQVRRVVGSGGMRETSSPASELLNSDDRYKFRILQPGPRQRCRGLCAALDCAVRCDSSSLWCMGADTRRPLCYPEANRASSRQAGRLIGEAGASNMPGRRYSWAPPVEAATHVYPCCLHSRVLGPTSDEAVFLATAPQIEMLFCPACRRRRPWDAA